MLKNKISPSMMCADPAQLLQTIRELEKADTDMLHIDIMDGSFVPNFTLGTDYCRALKKLTSIPLDIHLMIDEPERKLDWFCFGENDYVSIHAESTKHLERALSAVKARGAKALAAINPATPCIMLENILHTVDGILVMTVNPGFAGQSLINETLRKIEYLRRSLDERGYEHIEIEVDGNVSIENAKKMKLAGANIFVGGTSSIFRSDCSVSGGVEALRRAVDSIKYRQHLK